MASIASTEPLKVAALQMTSVADVTVSVRVMLAYRPLERSADDAALATRWRASSADRKLPTA